MAKKRKTEDCQFFSIKNFDTFQHYKNRNPPWVKLHYNILDDDDFLALDLVSQRNLMVLFMVASKRNNVVSNDQTYLQKVMRLSSPPDLSKLFNSGFLIASCYRKSSKVQAKSYSEAELSEAEAEAEADKDIADGLLNLATPEKLIELFNGVPGIKKTLSLGGTALATVQARIKENPDMAWWGDIVDKLIRPSDFLCGRKIDFSASLVWVCGPKNIGKVLAGAYANNVIEKPKPKLAL